MSLSRLTVLDVAELDREIGLAGSRSLSVDDLAQSCAEILYRFGGAGLASDEGSPLVRVFRTVRNPSSPEGQGRWLMLAGTYGDVPGWCQARLSTEYQRISLTEADFGQRYPMFAEVFRQIDGPRSSVRVESLAAGSWGPDCVKTFFIDHALESPHVPDKAFLVEHGIRSVVGFGGRLLDGDGFVGVMFLRGRVVAEAVESMRWLGVVVAWHLLESLLSVCAGEVRSRGVVYQSRLGRAWKDVLTNVLRELVDGRARDQAIMETQREEIKSYADRLQALHAQLLQAGEEERRILSHDLHDVVSTQLGSMAFHMKAVMATDGGSVDEMKASLERYRSELLRLASQTRSMAYALHPSSLEHIGLVDCLQTLVASRVEGCRWQVHWKVDQEAASQLSYAQQVGVYRIAEEALRNVERHAQAAAIGIRLVREPAGVVFEVEDFGRGCVSAEQDSLRPGRGLGLLGMRERARMLGGQLTFVSAPSKGAVVRVVVPAEGGGVL